MTGPRVEEVLVVVPARDEELLVGGCLSALADAVDAVGPAGTEPSTPPVHIVVVADRCRDRTAALARSTGAHVVETDAGSVGVARRAGVEAGRTMLTARPSRTWLASTDADTRVPREWLAQHLARAAEGAVLVTGRAVPDLDDLDPVLWRRWAERHPVSDSGPAVHGANLGVRMDAYLAVGGWPPLAEHEDATLVRTLLSAGAAAVAGPDVTTSGRRLGRVAGGFSGYLRRLEGLSPDTAATQEC